MGPTFQPHNNFILQPFISDFTLLDTKNIKISHYIRHSFFKGKNVNYTTILIESTTTCFFFSFSFF